MAERQSPFHPIIGDNEKSLRRLEADCFLEQWAASYEGVLMAINAFFCQIEENFVTARAAYAFPSTFDTIMLQIVRNSYAAQLIVKTKPQFAKLISARAQMPVKLPKLQKSEIEKWLDYLVKAGERRVLIAT